MSVQKFAKIFLTSGVLACLFNSSALSHPCAPVTVISSDWHGYSVGNFHNAPDDVRQSVVPAFIRVVTNTSSTSPQVVGSLVVANEIGDGENFTGSLEVSCSVTETWSVTANISTTLKGSVDSIIFPIGAEWETTVQVGGGWSNSETKRWGVFPDWNVPPCKRHEFTVKKNKTVVTAIVQEGDLETWKFTGTDGQPGSAVLLCNVVTATGSSTRFNGLEVSMRYATPRDVPGCTPGESGDNTDDDNTDDDNTDDGGPADGGGDNDGDGIPNSDDPDVDGDGIPNGEDNDIDGDGVPNEDDPDMDGDGVPNEDDDDIDGDGDLNEDDDEPNGKPGGGSIFDVIIDLITKILNILAPLF